MLILPLIKIFIITIALTKLTTGFEVNCNENECLSSLTQSDCPINEILLPNIVKCCPACVASSKTPICKKCKEDGDCIIGLQCESKMCGFDKSSCYYLAHMNPQEKLHWKPECHPTGKFKARQCRGDKVSGRCFCFSETGKKIFGWDWRYNEEEMTCACSRHRSKLEASGRISTLHCQQNGNYEELQCDAGVCFCVETKTGNLQEGTRVLPDTLWTKLPCYNQTLHGDSYLRQCESMAVTQKKTIKLFSLHGTRDAALEMANCNYDGSYGNHILQGTEVKCIWRDGKIIDPFSGPLSTLPNIDCACAIDTKIFEESNVQFKLTCSSNGNYDEAQLHQNGKYYCVDALGYAVSDFQADELTKEMCDARRYDRIETKSYCASLSTTTTSSFLL